MVDRVLLVEDKDDLRENYRKSLEEVKFEVVEANDGDVLLNRLREHDRDYFDVLVSDTDLIKMDGNVAVQIALGNRLLSYDKTLVIGISELSQNQPVWYDLANFGCFYEKCRIDDNRLGGIVAQCLKNFRTMEHWRRKLISPNW